MQVRTNNVPRPILEAYELSAAERAEFDYLDWRPFDPDFKFPTEHVPSKSAEDATFFRFKGELYDLGEFLVWDNPMSPTRGRWDGYRSDSFFSGLVVRYADDFESVVVGTFFADESEGQS